jgi:radical SAM family uncharacterized protein
MIPNHIRRLLSKVSKPSRYVGGEINIIRKEIDGHTLHFALAFPDTYEVGMSHLGLKILYKVLNEKTEVAAERVFAPWPDMGDLMRSEGVELYSLETYTPLSEFHVIGFTLQYELSYTNILYMLDLSNIPLLAKDREEHHPLIIAGGPCAFNAEPLADYIDAFVLGEGEEVSLEVAEAILEAREDKLSRLEVLDRLAQIPGVYVPAHYEPVYHEDETFLGFVRQSDIIRKRVVPELLPEYVPTAPVVPYTEVVHDRVMLEVFRGCTRGCRFCQAGMVYRPVREMPASDVLASAQVAIDNTGYEEVALTSLSTMDYSAINHLLPTLVDRLGCQGVNVSLPSLRVDSFSVQMASEVLGMRKSGLTLAPEAGSQRLRDVINKQVTEAELLSALQLAKRSGFRSAKLYFMIGLPTETFADLDELVRLVEKASAILPVTVSASSFVPKPHTPFQWEPQFSMYELEERQNYLRDKFRRYKRVKFKYHDASVSFLEAVFSRGDRRLGPVLREAYRQGCRFDGWSEHFSMGKWMEAFMKCHVDPGFYANRARNRDEILPWDHLSAGVSRNFLLGELQRAMRGEPTLDCSAGDCPACGVCADLNVRTITVEGRQV